MKEFKELTIRQRFICNGERYIKQSSRTARSVTSGTWHYFGMRELCYPRPISEF